MEHLILVTYCLKDEHGGLSALGLSQADFLGENVKRVVNGSSYHLISAGSKKAIETSKVISKSLGGDGAFEREDYLWSANDGPDNNYLKTKDLSRLVEVVTERREKAKNLIVIGHLEAIRDLTYYYAMQVLGRELPFKQLRVGQGISFNLRSWSYETFPKEIS